MLAGTLIVAVPFIFYAGREQWFHLDEWSFLTGRSLSNVSDLLDAHNGHWVTLPVIAYRLNYAAWGINSYLPYQALVIASHLGIAVLIHRVALRLEVGRWLATTGAIVFIFFGSGVQNLIFAFQVSLNSSVILGLVIVLLVSTDLTPRRRRIAVVLAVVGLMTSGVMVAMIAGSFTVVLLCHGQRRAVSFVAVPAAIYGLWFAIYGTTTARGTTAQTIEFASRITTATFEQLGASSIVGAALGALVAIGLLGRANTSRHARSLAPMAIPAGLLVAWLAFAGSAAIGRAAFLPLLPEAPEAGRYTHVGAALFMPLILIGAETCRRKKPILGLMAAAVLLAGVPTNVDRLLHPNPVGLGKEALTIAVANSDLAPQAPRDLRPISSVFGPIEVSVGWLTDARADGKVPGDGSIPESIRLQADGQIALQPSAAPAGRLACERPLRSRPITLQAGDLVEFDQPAVLARVVRGTERSSALQFASTEGNLVLDVVAGPLDVRFEGLAGTPLAGCVRETPDAANATAGNE